MTAKRVALEIGMGTDVRGGDSTKAAVRALKNALHRNSLSIAKALGQDPKDMLVDIRIGVPNPETVRHDDVLAVVPYGTAELTVIDGGLAMANEDDTDVMLLAHAAVVVRMNV